MCLPPSSAIVQIIPLPPFRPRKSKEKELLLLFAKDTAKKGKEELLIRGEGHNNFSLVFCPGGG